MLNKCELCGFKCAVNRNERYGICRCGVLPKLALVSTHMWEEPCISGETGSGTIFFSHCNLKCLFCQNYHISTLNNGTEITINRFVDICLELQSRKASNINLVTPTHYVPLIVEGLKKAKKKGLTIPIVYNTSAYETVETIKLLEGLVDIYLPDLKYYDNRLAKKYSGIDNYFEYAQKAIHEMYRQQPICKFNELGQMTKGIIVRHLLLPSLENDTKKILKYLHQTYHDNIYISIMNQYTPIRKLKYENLNHQVSSKIYDEIIDYAWELGIRHAFIQEEGTQKEIFIPDFTKPI